MSHVKDLGHPTIGGELRTGSMGPGDQSGSPGFVVSAGDGPKPVAQKFQLGEILSGWLHCILETMAKLSEEN